MERRRRISPPGLVIATLALAVLPALSSAGCQKGENKGEANATSGAGESAAEPSASTSASGSGAAEPSASASGTASASASATTTGSASSTSPAPTTDATATGGATSTASGPASGSAATSASAAPTCGEKGQPKCPLQGWMSSVMQPAMASKDATKLAAALRQSAKYAPPGYASWAKIANDGAAAVEASHDVTSAKKSCTDCHNSYKSKFKTESRARPL